MAIADDDEVTEPSWLENSLLIQMEYDSDVVVEPNLSYFLNNNVLITLHKTSSKITRADEAITYDSIPASRTNLKWILLRGYLTWSNYSSFEKELNDSL